jgi:hypothetical protein
VKRSLVYNDPGWILCTGSSLVAQEEALSARVYGPS